MKEVQKLVSESHSDLMSAGVKGSVGIAGSMATMTINDIAGLIVAVLTGIYMVLQIEAAWKKRKAAEQRDKELNGK